MSLSETTPNAGAQPSHRSQTHPQRQAGRIYTSISYVGSGLEGLHPVVVRCVKSFFVSSLLTSESDRLIAPISFYETCDRESLPFRINIGKAL
jgi:hypothetical protein